MQKVRENSQVQYVGNVALFLQGFQKLIYQFYKDHGDPTSAFYTLSEIVSFILIN